MNQPHPPPAPQMDSEHSAFWVFVERWSSQGFALIAGGLGLLALLAPLGEVEAAGGSESSWS